MNWPLLAAGTWCIAGFFGFMALHRIETWPSSQRAGWWWVAGCGPVVWLMIGGWILGDVLEGKSCREVKRIYFDGDLGPRE